MVMGCCERCGQMVQEKEWHDCWSQSPSRDIDGLQADQHVRRCDQCKSVFYTFDPKETFCPLCMGSPAMMKSPHVCGQCISVFTPKSPVQRACDDCMAFNLRNQSAQSDIASAVEILSRIAVAPSPLYTVFPTSSLVTLAETVARTIEQLRVQNEFLSKWLNQIIGRINPRMDPKDPNYTKA